MIYNKKNIYLHWNIAFWEVQSKAIRAFVESGEYHISVEAHNIIPSQYHGVEFVFLPKFSC